MIKEYGPQLFFADAGKIEEQERSAVKARTDLAPKSGAKMTDLTERSIDPGGMTTTGGNSLRRHPVLGNGQKAGTVGAAKAQAGPKERKMRGSRARCKLVCCSPM